jgi:hypothetical protein
MLPARLDDERLRYPSDRRERARAMAADGIFGGAGRGQGRKPKARTAGQDVAELAASEAPSIRRAYADGLRSRNERTRMVAADKLLAAERADRVRRATEPTREELLSALNELLPHPDEFPLMSTDDLHAEIRAILDGLPRFILVFDAYNDRPDREEDDALHDDSSVVVEGA